MKQFANDGICWMDAMDGESMLVGGMTELVLVGMYDYILRNNVAD